MIKNVLPSLRQRAGPQRICSRQKSIRSGTARDSFSQAPHMRGKELAVGVIRQHGGITPAHAGKSASLCSCAWLPGDHPRTCGEKFYIVLPLYNLLGSPPHMRGKADSPSARFRIDGITPAHAGKRAGQHRKGITPAHAGKSPAMSPGHITLRDHPRTCGEKGISDFSGNYEDGSPPHMRGKARSPLLFPGISRITPAHAGKRRNRELCG